MDKLFSISSNKKVKQWQVFVTQNEDGTASIIREHGYVGAKIQQIEKVISKGKNIGKKNETTPYTQAVSDALSLHQKRLDTGWSIEEEFDPEAIVELPMLAHTFTKRKHNIQYPCYVQPKLDGVRCFAKKVDEDTITYTSRKGKVYTTLDHLTPVLLEKMNVGDILDGEIYIHGKTFQHIVKLVKKLRPESITLQYHVYDIADSSLENWARLGIIGTMFDPNTCPPEIVLVRTNIVSDEGGIYQWHDNFVQEGYEGVIIRNRYGLYKFDNRSADLQKYKEFIDEEFEIVGANCSTGLHEGCVIFECITNGKTFMVYPKGTLEDRCKMWDNRDSYMGKHLTVRYQQLSEDGIPIFPIGLVVRDYE